LIGFWQDVPDSLLRGRIEKGFRIGKKGCGVVREEFVHTSAQPARPGKPGAPWAITKFKSCLGSAIYDGLHRVANYPLDT
jgi:hypothetical protein